MTTQSAGWEELPTVREEMMRRRSSLGVIIDAVGAKLASPLVLFGFLIFHLAWVVLNTGVIPGVPIWDPAPFSGLAVIDAALAPFITLLILMHQHRDGRIAELRSEVDLHVALRTTRQGSMILAALDELRQDLGLEASRPAPERFNELQQPLEAEHLFELLRSHLDRSEGKMAGEGGKSGRKNAAPTASE